jgi:putative salt-induced outer membrane protein YdiY
MKKTILLTVMMIGLAAAGWCGDKFQAVLTGSYLSPNDSAFKNVYGKGGFVPEIRLQYDLGPSFYLWGGAGIFAKKGHTPQLQTEAKSQQLYLSLGVGYNLKLSEKMSLRVGPGLLLVSYKEEVADAEQSASRIGFRADGDLFYSFTDNFLAGLTVGYLEASDTAANVKFKMGGFKVGGSIAFRF